MFKIYDLNMKEIPFPDGVMPLEIFVGSVGKNRTTDTVDGRAGVVDYGFNYTDRPVSLFLRIKAADKIDFRLLRNEVFAIFDIGNAFYVAESDVPSRVLKVVVDESYIPDRLTEEYADFDIVCRTLDSVFWESIYTTLELHDTGYSATAEKYGLVDNIDDEKVKYRFDTELETVDLTSDLFEPGNIHNTSGFDINSATDYVKTKSHHVVVPGVRYTIDLNDYTGDVSYIRLHYFREDGVYIGNDNSMSVVDSNGKSTHTFTAQSERLRLVIYPKANKQIKTIDIGNSIQIKLIKPSASRNFTVYNAGNVTVEPESMFLEIYFNVATSDGNLTLINKTTGDEFKFYRNIERRNLTLKGMVFREGSIPRFKDTNKRFIRLAPGDNHFTMSGNSGGSIVFNFKYYYK